MGVQQCVIFRAISLAHIAVGEMAQRERLRDLAVFERLHGNPVKTSPELAVKKVDFASFLLLAKGVTSSLRSMNELLQGFPRKQNLCDLNGEIALDQCL